MSTEEEHVKNASAAQKGSRQRKRFPGEFYDDITEWQLSEKKRKRAEANRRYRERQKLLKNSTSRAKSEYNKIYRERKRLRQADTVTTTASVSSKILTTINDNPESDQYEAEIRYQQFLPKQPSPQNAIHLKETSASDMVDMDMNFANIQVIQTDSDDSNVPLQRRKVRQSSSSEVNFDDLLEDCDEYSISTENQSDSDCISISDIVPTTEELANMSPAEKAAEADKRYRLMKKLLKPNKPLPLTASERSRAYRKRQKSLQNHAAKILTKGSKSNFNETEEVNDGGNKNGRRTKALPKTPAQKSKEYRERKRSMILAAFGGITTRKRKVENLKEAITSDNNEDDKESAYTGPKKQLRYVLTLDERVAVIHQFDAEPNIGKLAINFNCTVEQIMSVVSNRNAILEFNETTINLSKKSKEPGEMRRRKLNLFGYCLYEYAQRAQFHFNVHITEELILQRAIEFRDLMGIDGFTPDKTWINQFMAAYNVNSSNSSINITQRPRISLDFGNIMSHCVRHSAMASNLQPNIPETVKIDITQVLDHAKTMRNNSNQNQGTLIELESDDDDDSVAINADCKDDISNSPRTPSIEGLAENLEHSSLKVEKLHHSPLHIADYQVVDEEMPEITPAPSMCPNPEASDEEPLPRCVESFKDALRLLKPLEDFALMGENYRVIGLLSQLEQIFEAGKKAEQMGSSSK